MREIYTYANPLLMNQDTLIWDMVNKYPQFCASDTLSQGMIQYYGRKEFGIIQTMNDLQKALLGSVTDNTHFDMQLFLDVSHEVRKRNLYPDITKSFRKNLGEIVQAIRHLMFLDALPEKLFDIEDITTEQHELFSIYQSIYPKYKDELKQLMIRDRKDIDKAIRGTVIKEAEYVIKINRDSIKESDYHCKELSDARYKLLVIRNNLKKRIDKRHEVEYTNTFKEKHKLERVEYVMDLIDRLDSVSVDTIIIHGVHKFTPEILMTLRLLEKQSINVIFLIHYVDKLPQVYNTWKEVYAWTKEDFKNIHSFDINVGSATGIEIAKIYSGGLSSIKVNAYKASYDNLIDFTVGEVRPTFSQASEQLQNMRIQYYAVSNTDVNEILKNYFPEQFEVKPFLSYPIGQFILGLYNMWDFEKACMKINPKSLKECVSSGVLENNELLNISEIYEDIALYISDLDNVEAILRRLEHLKSEKCFIERNIESLGGLKAICFFSRKIEDIDKFIKFLKLLEELSIRVFSQKEDQISYSLHFRNLMEILVGSINNTSLIHNTEIQLAQEVLNALEKRYNKEIIGDYSDVKEALTFFLHQSRIDDSSNWIVRNFEQLDGAVLLANSTKAREYHFALMSMKNMTRNVRDELPWPLDEQLFYKYDCEIESEIQASALSIRERANFLKYSLFFATFFFKKRITFSYIVNQNDEKQKAYYLLDLLKLRELKKEENADINFSHKNTETKEQVFDYSSLTIDQREMFAICKYKYFLNRILGEGIVYRDDFQIKYFLQNYIVQVVMDDDKLTLTNYVSKTKKYIRLFRVMFPNYDNIIFSDLERKVIMEVYSSLDYCIKHNLKYKKDNRYKRRKKNFLLAQWKENGLNNMDFNNVSERDVIDYMLDEKILLPLEDKPHTKVCENCNFSVDCLLNYDEELRRKE